MQDRDGRTALDIAHKINRPKLAILLIKEGTFSAPNPVLENFFLNIVKSSKTSIIEAILRKDIENPDYNDTNNRTTVPWAAEKGHEVIVKLLLDTGCQRKGR